jgi:quercetin dioxygenase-like cupin family protein
MHHDEGDYNPATGERNFFTVTGPDSGGELLRFGWELDPGGRVPLHIHPNQEETFHIHEGLVRFTVGWKLVVCGPGESVTVPRRTRHRFVNASPGLAKATIELRPALNFQQFLETFAALARDGKTTKAGVPYNPFQLAVAAHAYWGEFRTCFPPRTLQRVLLPPGARLGRALGYDSRFEPRTPATGALA